MDTRKGPFDATWESLAKIGVPKWYLDAKFGIFIHWGIYAVPAFADEWYPRNMYIRDSQEFRHHSETYGPHMQFGYKNFIPQLTAANWDPAAWAELFAKAGARYVVPVAEHHDGFPMYDCSFSDWSALKMGPKRDIIADLAKEIRARGMTFGASSHRAFNWRYYTFEDDFDTIDPANVGLYGRPHPPNTPADEEFMEDWLARTCEFVDKYQPELMWFDFCFNYDEFEPYRRRFAAHYYNRAIEWGREVAINYKDEAFPPKAGVLDIERGKLDYLRPLYWQTDTSVCRKSWCYIQDPDYKSVPSLLADLVDIVSMNGCLLLNIAPRPDGTIPDEQQQILLSIGEWLKVNGEAIYDTRPWTVFGEGPTRFTAGNMQEGHDAALVYTAGDIRFTANGNTLYAIMLAWPKDKITIESLGTNLRLFPAEISSVELVGSDAPLQWSRDAHGLHVTLPADRPCDHLGVLRIRRKE